MANWLLRVIKGALIGVGAILPGISGGVLSVVLGIYRPLMRFLAHPVKTFKRHASFLIPILIGFAIGVILLSRLVDWLFRTSPTPAVWLFVGLVVGTLPPLWKEAGLEGRPRGAIVSLIVAGLLMGLWMWIMARISGTHVTPNTFWWILCGALWGIGLIVPGLSPSSFFIFFGLYQPMTAAIGHFDLTVILPMGLGLAATIALLARGMNKLLKHAYSYVMHAILGIVIASTIAILPLGEPATGGQIALFALCFAVGCGIALAMDLLSRRFQAQDKMD
ncbi:DUF368 domain-containing protein [Eubacteriales bacterium OttesenSCG-928-A19]|nr:DUF368 domain-containing protein [Eubacteriales bacterium OttesenSCG-928-A19]